MYVYIYIYVCKYEKNVQQPATAQPHPLLLCSISGWCQFVLSPVVSSNQVGSKHMPFRPGPGVPGRMSAIRSEAGKTW